MDYLNKKIKNYKDLIEYISKPMDQEELEFLYKINNIKIERVELYLDFIHTLFYNVTETYLGDDVVKGDDIKKHFDWCWDKSIKTFELEGIFFLSDDLYNYFYSLFFESFYKEEDKSDENVNQLIFFWEDIFDYRGEKSKSDLESLLDLYKIFNDSLFV